MVNLTQENTVSTHETLPDWDVQSQFRRYVLFPKALDLKTSKRLREQILKVDLGPYLPWEARGGVVLIPKREDLEKFYVLPLERVLFARTSRDPEHDAALVRVIRVINRELRLMEQEQNLEPLALGKSMCDDCGAHKEHRSRRMITNHWPVADGSTCAPWKGVAFNQTYGNVFDEGEQYDAQTATRHDAVHGDDRS